MLVIFLVGSCIMTVESCSEISQKVTYEDGTGYCVLTYTNGLYNHGFDDFNTELCNLSETQLDSVKQAQNKLAENFLKNAK
jgi:tryptophan synthase alpha subunit